jgi:hypothetical protein
MFKVMLMNTQNLYPIFSLIDIVPSLVNSHNSIELFMQSRGRFVGDLAGTSGKGGGGMGLSPLLMMLMMNGGGGKMVALMPFLLQNGGNWVTWVVTVR